jgi:hypothetical protein
MTCSLRNNNFNFNCPTFTIWQHAQLVCDVLTIIIICAAVDLTTHQRYARVLFEDDVCVIFSNANTCYDLLFARNF